jgi:hypothetical protein
MTYTLKLRGGEVSVNSSAQTAISNAVNVRLFNTGTIANVVQYLAGNTFQVVGYFTIQANTGELIQKGALDTLGANTTSGVLGTPIAFRD